MKFDNTGEWLVIGNAPRKRPKQLISDNPDGAEIARSQAFFLQHAFFFLDKAEQVFRDSRLFLAPVSIQNELAYIGTDGLSNPTLGIYLEWWLNGKGNITTDNEGLPALTYHFSGSPLSGVNYCKCVYPNGQTKTITHRDFASIWIGFKEINQKYTKAKQLYEAFNIEDAYRILNELK